MLISQVGVLVTRIVIIIIISRATLCRLSLSPGAGAAWTEPDKAGAGAWVSELRAGAGVCCVLCTINQIQLHS